MKRSRPGEPLVSVITVVFNGASHLETAVRSVVTQDYGNVEYIVIDGGSSDGTLDILRRHQDVIDYWVSAPDQGIYDAMNKGVGLASGDWIYFLGSDDVLLNSLSTVVPSLKNDREIYYGDVYMPGRHRVYNGKFSAWSLARRNICHQAVFYPRSVVQKYPFNLRYQFFADWEMNMRCHGDPELRFVYLPVLVAIYDDVNGATSTCFDSEFVRDQMALIKKNFSRPVYFWARLKRGIRDLLRRSRRTTP